MMICLTSCEGDGKSPKDEFGRSSIYAWSYIGKNRNEVEAELKKAGWELNYSGKTSTGNPVVLYIYNRPSDLNWKPWYFTKYAYDSQQADRTGLRTLMDSGKMYGELYVLMSDGIVQDMGIFWMMPTSNDVLDRYMNFSNRIYQTYTGDCGNDASWFGKIETINYSDRQRFFSAIRNAYEPSFYEYGHDNRSNIKCSYGIDARFNYYLDNTFYLAFDGEKYSN